MSSPSIDRRQMLAACLAAAAASSTRPAASLAGHKPPARQPLGVVIHSFGVRQSAEKNQEFSAPLPFAQAASQLGAAGIQVAIGVRSPDYLAKLRDLLAAAGMYIEGIVRLPRDEPDLPRFEAELTSAKSAGATVLRTVMLDGRRYEAFDSAAAFARHAAESWRSLQWARPVAERLGVRLAIENHKDWRVADLLGIVRRCNSPQIGICVDTGNSIALLEDPLAVVAEYAPYAFTTHFKDMAVAEYADGFLLAETPLGTGYLDLKKMVSTLRDKQPAIRLNLEMITRDPLKIPCLSSKYWATFPDLPAKDLAATLHAVRTHAAKDALPHPGNAPLSDRLRIEQQNVERSFTWATQHLTA